MVMSILNNMNIKKKNNLLKILGLLATVVVALLIWWFLLKDLSSVGEDGISYAPATKDDKKFNDQIKNELPAKTDSSSPQQQVAIKEVKPSISAWGQPNGSGTDFHLNGFVDGIIESDGRCTLTMEKDGTTVDTAKNSLQNAQSTSCGQMTMSYTKLTPGKWTAILSYSSSASKGSSDPVVVEVR